jgi:hypothetical protein
MAQVKWMVTRSSMTRVSNLGKVPGSESRMESGTVSDKGLGKRPGKNSGKEAGQDKTCKIGRFLCFGPIQFEGGDLMESGPRIPSQEEDQRIWFKFKDRVEEEIGLR